MLKYNILLFHPSWVQIFSSAPCSQTSSVFVGFQVFTAVIMKTIIFWDMMPCSPLGSNRRFGGKYGLHLLFATYLLAGLLNLFLRPSRRRRYVPPKRRLKLDGLHGVISQKMILSIFSLCSSLKVRDQISHPYKTTGKVLIFVRKISEQ
jgi:hypothetical protein